MTAKEVNLSAINQPSQDLTALENQKKKRKDLLQVATVLKSLEGELVNAKGAVTEGSAPATETLVAPGKDDSKGETIKDAMAQMMMALQMLELLLAKVSKLKADSDNTISQSLITQAQQVLTDSKKQLQDLSEQQASQKERDFWIKFAEIAVATIVSIVSIALGQPQIAILTIAMTVASVSGGFDKLSGLISDGLQKAGLSPMVADIIAKAIVLVVVIVATAALTPGTAAAAAAQDAESTGVEMADMTADTAAEATTVTSETATTAQDSTSFATKLSNFNAKWNPLSWNARVTMSVMNGAQAVSQLNIGQIVQDDPNLTPEEKSNIQLILTIVLAITTLILSLAGAAGMASLSSSGRLLSQEGSVINNALRPLIDAAKNMVGNAAAIGALHNLTAALQIGEGATQVVQGTTIIQQGTTMGALATDNAAMDLNSSMLQMMKVEIANSQRSAAAAQKERGSADVDSVANLAKGDQAMAELLAQSPV